MYNIDFECTYKNIQDEEGSDDQYRKDVLNAFGISKYHFDSISHKVSEIYKKIDNNTELHKLLQDMYKLSPFALTTNDIDLEYGLLLLFSYEYFEHFHKILQKYYRNMEFNEELSELKKIAKI
tara:strand:- start:3035 stop:3403 length:369 start_codon:yes stop_codon:yes gene_type:complete